MILKWFKRQQSLKTNPNLEFLIVLFVSVSWNKQKKKRILNQEHTTTTTLTRISRTRPRTPRNNSNLYLSYSTLLVATQLNQITFSQHINTTVIQTIVHQEVNQLIYILLFVRIIPFIETCWYCTYFYMQKRIKISTKKKTMFRQTKDKNCETANITKQIQF